MKRTGRRLLLAVGVVLVVLLAASCSNLGYYSQAAWGQARLLVKKRPIEKLVEDPAVSDELRRQLETVLEIRAFAVQELLLPDNGSYRSYVELLPEVDGSRRRSVVWNVVAAPELDTTPVTWCFPVAGCVSYRGYFSRRWADRFAARLGAEGYDVAVAGTSAYSTLGWFKDPVLSTVIDYPEVYLAAFVFHELAHQLVYVGDDSTFNESFATAVEIEGVRRWLETGERDLAVMEDYLARMRREQEFAELVLGYRERLAEMYAEDLPDESKRRRKDELFAELKASYRDLRASWGSGDYDTWFERELNNAHLVSVGAYHGLVPTFQELLASHDHNLARFYEAVRELAARSPEERFPDTGHRDSNDP